MTAVSDFSAGVTILGLFTGHRGCIFTRSGVSRWFCVALALGSLLCPLFARSNCMVLQVGSVWAAPTMKSFPSSSAVSRAR